MFNMSRLSHKRRTAQMHIYIYIYMRSISGAQNKEEDGEIYVDKTKTARNHQLLNTVFLESIDFSFCVLYLCILCVFVCWIFRFVLCCCCCSVSVRAVVFVYLLVLCFSCMLLDEFYRSIMKSNWKKRRNTTQDKYIYTHLTETKNLHHTNIT